MPSKSTTSHERQNQARTVIKRAATVAAERLERCIMGTETLTPAEFNACKLAINKVVPDLKATEVKHTDAGGADSLKELMHIMDRSKPSLLSEDPVLLPNDEVLTAAPELMLKARAN